MAGLGWGMRFRKERVVGPTMSPSCSCSVPVPGLGPHLATKIQADDTGVVVTARAWLPLQGREPALGPSAEPVPRAPCSLRLRNNPVGPGPVL